MNFLSKKNKKELGKVFNFIRILNISYQNFLERFRGEKKLKRVLDFSNSRDKVFILSALPNLFLMRWANSRGLDMTLLEQNEITMENN